MITTELSQMTHKKRSLPHPLHPCTYLKAIGHVAVKPGKIESDILTKDLQIRLYSEKYVTYAPVLLSSNDEICAQFGRKGEILPALAVLKLYFQMLSKIHESLVLLQFPLHGAFPGQEG